MLQLANKEKEQFSLVFGGENDIDINTLIDSLSGTVQLMNYIAREKEPEAFLKVNVTGTEKGSFKIDLVTMVGIVPTILNSGNIGLAKQTIELFSDLIQLKKHLKGEPPKAVTPKGSNIDIVNKDNENVTIYNNTFNLYNADCDKIISKIFTEKVYERKSFSVLHDGKEKVRVDNEEFNIMSKEIDLDKIKDIQLKENVNQSRVILKIKKIDLNGNSQWELIHPNSSKIIKVNIEDKKFIDKLHNGEIFVNAKSTLDCILETATYFNEINEVEKYAHSIIEVKEVKTEPFEQLKI